MAMIPGFGQVGEGAAGKGHPQPAPRAGWGQPALLARAERRRCRTAAHPSSPAYMPALRVTIGAIGAKDKGR